MAGISKSFFKVEPGQLVYFQGKSFKVTHLMSVDSVLAVDTENNESQRLHIDAIKLVAPERGDDPGDNKYRDLALYSDEEWAEAQRRFQAALLHKCGQQHLVGSLDE